MWIFYENPDLTFDDVKPPYSLPKLRKKAIFVAVGTTSGTGTEVTSFAVITEDKTWPAWPSPTPCWASSTPWPIKSA